MIRIVESNFIKSAVKPADYAVSEFPDVAFVGKSNVGKSSLLNTILNRKGLAKTSSTPGKTQLINFFNIRFKPENSEENGFINFVDLPGYGYAKVSKKERENWKKMIGSYFEQRIQLRGVLLLVDIRHKADPKDLITMQMLTERNIPFLIVATKSDKIPKTKIKQTINKLKTSLQLTNQTIIPFSSLKKAGIKEVLSWIEQLIL